jgi:hypothetical protein
MHGMRWASLPAERSFQQKLFLYSIPAKSNALSLLGSIYTHLYAPESPTNTDVYTEAHGL